MKNYANIKFIAGIYTMMILTLAGCIRDGLDICPPTETLLYITVQVENEEVNNNLVDEAIVYLFDNNRTYIDQIKVSAEDIAMKRPVPVPYLPEYTPYITVWGNIKNNEEISQLTPGITIDELLISLKKDTEGYSNTPDALFFGQKKLSGLPREEVTIAPKTGKTYITVKGLPENTNEEDYYFTVESRYNGYSFSGIPVTGENTIKMPGVFNARHDLVTTRVYDLIHYPAELSKNKDEVFTLNLYRKTDIDSQLLVSVNEDTNGKQLIPEAGKTINILIDFNESGKSRITIVVTPWDEIYQWSEW